MKYKFLANIGALVFVIGIFYFVRILDFSYEADHPTLNEHSVSPDIEFRNVRKYTRESDRGRSLYHLDQAMESIKYLESDVDLNTSEIVDEALIKLIFIYDEIKDDTLITEDMNHAFEFALTSLSLAELRVSERYAESNRLSLSRIALKYSKLHLKHALEYTGNDKARLFEKRVYQEIDSLLENYEEAPVLITKQIDHMIDEMDSLLQIERAQSSRLYPNH